MRLGSEEQTGGTLFSPSVARELREYEAKVVRVDLPFFYLTTKAGFLGSIQVRKGPRALRSKARGFWFCVLNPG